jgi:hypothetical protein
LTTEDESAAGAGERSAALTRHPAGHLAANPLPTGIVGALGLNGYQLLADVGGVGAGRLGSHVFLLVAPDPDPRLPDPGTQISLHNPRLRDEAEASAFKQLAAHLGYLRLSGYRLAPERVGLRSKIAVVDPATGAIAITIPDKHPGRLFGGGRGASSLLAAVRALPPAGAPADPQNPELMRDVVLALALADEQLTGAQAAEVADRALSLARERAIADPVAALEAAKGES